MRCGRLLSIVCLTSVLAGCGGESTAERIDRQSREAHQQSVIATDQVTVAEYCAASVQASYNSLPGPSASSYERVAAIVDRLVALHRRAKLSDSDLDELRATLDGCGELRLLRLVEHELGWTLSRPLGTASGLPGRQGWSYISRARGREGVRDFGC